MAIANRFVLASKSPFRQQILKSMGLTFDVCGADVEEKLLVADNPKKTALLRARAKALDVSAGKQGCLVLGCDQTLGLGGQHFDKAASREEAKQRLQLLSGKTHHLHSAMVIAYCAEHSEPQVLSETTADIGLSMRDLSDAEIEAYLNTQEWQGVVGAYRMESLGGLLFDKIGGDSSAVIGLPVTLLSEELRKLGINPLLQGQGPWNLSF